jgi:1-acyl-sn-glycerol-3-phosphate acyltransferase
VTERVLRRPPPALYELIRKVFQFLAWLLLRQDIVGQDNLPSSGSYLIVVNHLSIADPPMIFVNVPQQLMMFVADKWKKVPGISHLATTVGAIWVARGEADLAAIKTALTALKSGQPLGIAPEGTRSRTRSLQRARTGAAYLADRAGVPVVPVAISGTERLGENVRRLRRTPVRMVIGEPFRLPPNGRAKGDVLDAYTDSIMCRVAALLPPEYRGVYADHPELRALLAAADQPSLAD